MATENPPTNGIPDGTHITNGEVKSTKHGENLVDAVLENEEKPTAPPGKYSPDDLQLVLQSFRLLIADLCQQFNMGHPGYVHAKLLLVAHDQQKR